ncbi:hypothetical protein CRG98_037335 [Punica granatum]|uniref:Uncharacterized protein n=1 Tax=Punica granatum TaxID=22663 RepID=A0A2I0IE47_PUNGR|nr:hypothetical protein CRG98_037335 [Punica granatum]
MTSPKTHGISMNPMKKVTDPHSIRLIETPSSREAKPAGVICGAGGRLLDEEGAASDAGGAMRDSSPEKETGVGADRMRLSTTVDSSYRALD